MDKTVLILGGYGIVGKMISKLLLQETEVKIIIAGRNKVKAEKTADELNTEFKIDRVSAEYANASDISSLKKVFRQADIVVVASSTSQYTREIAQAAIDVKIDYLDMQYSTSKIAELKKIDYEIEKQGCTFITDGGFHPGLPAVLVRYISQHFDSMEKAIIGSVIKINWAGIGVTDGTYIELLEELKDYNSSFYKDGKWRKPSMVSMKDYLTMDLEEMGELPNIFPTLKTTGFYVGSFNWFVDWIVLPLAMFSFKVFPHKAINPMAKLMKWGLIKFSKPPYGTLLKVEASGIKNERLNNIELTIGHEDGYMLTAIPIVATLLQYLDSSFNKPGLYTQAIIVDPNRLLKDMEKIGVEYTIRYSSPQL